ncbi:MAG TPA: heme o synthase [Actinomycetota bacterium]
MTRFSKLAVATAITTVALFSVGGLVRGSGSGLGCSTWPQCDPGQLFPSGTIHSLIEFSHRALAFVVIVLTALCGIVAIRSHRDERRILWPAVLSFPLVLSQAVLGGIVVATELNPWWVTAHFVMALALIADVTYLAAASIPLSASAGVPSSDRARFARLTLVTTGLIGALLLVGTFVRASNAQLVFTDWPLMDGRLIPSFDAEGAIAMFAHRLLALAGFSFVLWTMVRARTATHRSRPLVILSTVTFLLFVAQILSGAANVITKLKPWAVVVHVALSVLIWASLVALATVAGRLRGISDVGGQFDGAPGSDTSSLAGASTGPGDDPAAEPSLRDTIRAYVQLTKPRIIVLLLITTVPAMVLAERGLPSLWLMAATLIGGTIAAGSANSINMYLDRDIDQVMKRTRGRPLPAHLVSPQQALTFGFWLGAFSFLFLGATVNMLAATLSLAAIAFYVFVYTMWLKRSTTQNIVIGGAAGAAPALIGWAAVTGSLALPAWIMFAIVFVWTPPHFWALALRFQGDYAAAGVPMLPVVKGDDETRRQIFLYSLVLFGTTLLLAPVADLGAIYVSTAVVLGGLFVYRALVLWRRPDPDRGWRLFTYSILYLAALFGAVALDALIPRSG